jgi:hypothetical protein
MMSGRTFLKTVLTMMAFLGLVFPGPLGAQVFRFEVTNTLDLPDANLGDLQCAASNGQCTLRAAVDQLNSIGAGFELKITFQVPGMEFNLSSPLSLAADIVIEGFGIDFTTIDGGGGAAFYIFGDVNISGLTISNGRIEVFQEQSLTLVDSKITGANSPSAGGAISSYGLTLTLTGCQFIGNSATFEGGAVYAIPHIAPGSTLTIADCEFRDNTAGEEGAAIFSSVDTTINNSEITNNIASMDGGGIFISGDPDIVTIVETNIGLNEAVNGAGIALDTTATTVKIVRSSLYLNDASNDGGGVYTSGTEILHITNSTISNNTAVNNGGGIAFANASVTATLNNCTIAENTADADGATNNGNGGGISNMSSTGIIEIRNTIIADNDDASSGTFGYFAPDCSGEIFSYGYNLFGYVNSLCDLQGDAIGNLVGDPNSGAIDPRVGTLVQNPSWPTYAYTMLSDTPAKDSANPSGCIDWDGTPLVTDQIGVERPAGVGPDIGARELQVLPMIFSDGFETGDTSAWLSVP